uniref:C2H2-type domain-containing protein n=1 Tax=Anabas testudineus TaxID=64144 RepID=A0A3Q1JQU5_ANATE
MLFFLYACTVTFVSVLFVADLPQANSTVDHGDKHNHTLLQKPSTPEEPSISLSIEVQGPSQPRADMDNNILNYSLAETDLDMSNIKEEQEEHVDDRQTQEIVFPSSELMKSEQDDPETHVLYEMQPVSSDSSAAQSEDNYSDGELKDQSYIGSLMKHIKTHESTTDCTICGMTYQSRKWLIAHLQNCHKKTNFCDTCGKIFASNRCLRLHEKTHTDITEFGCQECGKTFHRKEHLVVHMRTHSGEKPYHCDICGDAFSQSQNLISHKRSHLDDRPYHCDLCGKRFNTGGDLKRHMRCHTGEKPYPCDICGKCFRRRGHMTRHRRTHTRKGFYYMLLCKCRGNWLQLTL